MNIETLFKHYVNMLATPYYLYLMTQQYGLNWWRNAVPVSRMVPDQTAAQLSEAYRRWCFLWLAQEIAQMLDVTDLDWTGTPTAPSKVVFGEKNYWLMYQEQADYSKLGSYSIPLQPDLILHGPSGPIVAFDTHLGPVELDSPEIYRLHTYRDALHARAALILQPSEAPNKFYHIDFRPSTTVTLHELLHQKWEGVGIMPLVPPVDLPKLD